MTLVSCWHSIKIASDTVCHSLILRMSHNIAEELPKRFHLNQACQLYCWHLRIMSSKKRIAAAIVTYILKKQKKRRRHQMWVREWIRRRSQFGFCSTCTLKLELRSQDPCQLANFLRMSLSDFEDILRRIEPKIQKKDTPMRKSIPAHDRLAITLRFLATGK